MAKRTNTGSRKKGTPSRQTPKRGRPSTFSKTLARKICERLAAGESLRKICKDDNMPHESTVRSWVVDDYQGFSTQYARARDIGLDSRADRILEIAEGSPGSNPQRDRLRFDAERWYLSKLAPKKYGDRLQQEITGPIPSDDEPINYEEMARRLLFVLEGATYKMAIVKAAKAVKATGKVAKKVAAKKDAIAKSTKDELEAPPSPPTLPWCDEDE